jgi:hypothetical protein
VVRKVLILLIFFSGLVFASKLDDKIKDFVAPKTYKVHKNLISVLFKHEKKFMLKNGKVDLIKVAETLKKNGLLNIFFDKPKYVEFEFKTTTNHLLFMKIVSDSLKSIGYNFIITKSAKKSKDGFSWKIVLKAEYLIDPVMFSKELNKRGSFIEDIFKKSDVSWIYNINSTNGFLPTAKKIQRRELVNLKKSVDDYLITIDNGSIISVKSHSLNKWYPNIVFYDSKLNILKIFRVDKRQRRVLVTIPNGTKYIKISDIYTLSNIKRGLKVLIK